MNNLVWLFGIATINGLILGYAGNMQTTTKWLGKRLFLHKDLYLRGEIKGSPNQWQSYVTPPTQLMLNLSQMALFGITIMFLLETPWYYVALAILTTFIVAALAKSFFPKNLSWYLEEVGSFLERRRDKCLANKDQDRATLADDVCSYVKELFQEATKSQTKILDRSLD